MNANGAKNHGPLEAAEADLEHALRNFRASVHAWSEAELSRPRLMPVTLRHARWRAAAWASACVIACLIVAGSLTAGLYQHRRGQLTAGHTQQPQLRREQIQPRLPIAGEPAAQGDEGLMAKVDSDVSRPVPSAMEPLARLMNESPDQ
ncbi:MAG TPA: hypothetical protein VKU93_08180 [Terracidiphilus sp.]|nr:hypothetical protein [Terracidiphilus sp.]